VGVTTQDSALELRLDPAVGAKRLKNYLKYVNMELTTIARACGKRAALPAPPSPDADTLMPGGSGDELTPRDAGVVLFAS
jgi:hypothetical protein